MTNILKKVSATAGIPSRKDRRADAKLNGVDFVPQYNGTEPVRGQRKDVAKRNKKEQVGLA